MSEQYPLLSEELTEQETPSSRHRRLLLSKERARYHVKGAAAIITRWPRHWTTLLTYWWIGIGMLAITTYIIYNIVFLHMADSYKLHRPAPLERFTNLSKPTKLVMPPKVFMHVFLDEKQEINMDKYLPYIDIVTNKYRHLKFELILVYNDIFIEIDKLSDKNRNELAMNNLWNDNAVDQYTKQYDNFKIKYMTLSTHFYDSPLKNHWKKLNPELQKFLVRALSVWQKGGIAFDPIILTPQSPNSIYIEKIYTILKKYNPKKGKKILKTHKLDRKLIKTSKPKPKPNNIRDIIDALEEESIAEKNISESLMADETINVATMIHERETRSTIDGKATESEQNKTYTIIQTTVQKQENHTDNLKYNLLPMFLEYLFHKPTKLPNSTINLETNEVNTTEHVKLNNKTEIISTKRFWEELARQNIEKPVVVSAKRIVEKANDSNNTNTGNVLDDFEVIIDLRGNIIATDTVCHAFIGNLFSNVVHYNDTETVTDFIIKKVSSFCKGLLASCVGIDVILL